MLTHINKDMAGVQFSIFLMIDFNDVHMKYKINHYMFLLRAQMRYWNPGGIILNMSACLIMQNMVANILDDRVLYQSHIHFEVSLDSDYFVLSLRSERIESGLCSLSSFPCTQHIMFPCPTTHPFPLIEMFEITLNLIGNSAMTFSRSAFKKYATYLKWNMICLTGLRSK